ncbi:MAG TPA: hypothetical protein VFW86_05855 [Candidatus Limnocylindrales bacterium]|nr:hypothetical protein [Candidatus Limnocylindrales bacterium]
MFRDAIIHMQGEQPMVADLPELPGAGAVALICTNLRTVDGKRPVFIEASENTFVIPLVHIRFVELPEAEGAPRRTGEQALQLPAGSPAEPEETEFDEDFLRRIREV